jgi:hypothetical protein
MLNLGLLLIQFRKVDELLTTMYTRIYVQKPIEHAIEE